MKSYIFLISFLIFRFVVAEELPTSIQIKSISYSGTGCDAASASVSVTPDLNYLSVLYDKFSIILGEGSEDPNLHRAEKNCDMVIKFDLPPGWNFQFDSVEYRGFVALPDRNSYARQIFRVTTPNGKARNFQVNTIRGPIMQNFQNIYNNEGKTKIHRPKHYTGGTWVNNRYLRKDDYFNCSDKVQEGVLMISSKIMLKNSLTKINPLAQFVVDSSDLSFSQKLRINWNKCIR